MKTKTIQKLMFISSLVFVLLFTCLAFLFRFDLFLRRVFLDVAMCGLWFFGNTIGYIIVDSWLKRKNGQKPRGRLE
jgi:hypothetical protein